MGGNGGDDDVAWAISAKKLLAVQGEVDYDEYDKTRVTKFHNF